MLEKLTQVTSAAPARHGLDHNILPGSSLHVPADEVTGQTPTALSFTIMSTPDEETPLLRSDQTKKHTPLPWGQFSIILFLQLAEPLTSQVIYPFAPAVRCQSC